MFLVSAAANSTIGLLRAIRRLIVHGRGKRGRRNEAIEAIRRAIKFAPDNPNLYHDLGNLLVVNRDLEQAEAAQRRAIQLDPKHLGGNKGLLPILWRKNELAEFRAVYAVTKDIMNLTLPASLQIGLGQFPTNIPQAPLRSGGASADPILMPNPISPPSPALGERQQWVEKANVLVNDWLLFNQDKLHEIDEISEYPDFAGTLVNAGGAMLVTAHFGPPMVAASHLAALVPESRIVTSKAQFINLPQNNVIVPNEHSRNLFLLRMMDCLREDKIVFWAGDTSSAEMPPTLAYHAKVPIYWYIAMWRDGRIIYQLRPGPAVDDGESLDQWLERWLSFYAQNYIDALLSNPENVRPSMSYKHLLRICDRGGYATDRIRDYLPQNHRPFSVGARQ